MSDLVLPGDHVGTLTTSTPGPGTYVRGANIYSSVFGVKCVEPRQPSETQPQVWFMMGGRRPLMYLTIAIGTGTCRKCFTCGSEEIACSGGG